MKEIKIIAKDLYIGYKTKQKGHKLLYSSIDFELKSGELTTIMGVNGAGKSTLIKTICGITPPLGGCIEINGKDISKISQAEMSKYISIVLTERVADGGLTGYDIISLGRYHNTSFFGKLSQLDIEIIEQSIESVGVESLCDKQIASMSDGERQKIMIAKSLCQRSDIIILDEPTAFLDIRSRIELMQLLRECAKKQNRAILVSSHDLEQSLQFSDNLWVLSKGEGLYCDTTEQSVISGNIEKIIGDNTRLHMDYNIGAFVSRERIDAAKIRLEGEGQFLVANAVRRQGHMISTDAQITVTINNYNDMTLTTKSQIIKITSIEELINILNTL